MRKPRVVRQYNHHGRYHYRYNPDKPMGVFLNPHGNAAMYRRLRRSHDKVRRPNCRINGGRISQEGHGMTTRAWPRLPWAQEQNSRPRSTVSQGVSTILPASVPDFRKVFSS
jgi:hypothetical protein